jgi:biopolymer transport protein ExbB/TolQ
VSGYPREAPPVGEEIHLPGPTILPFVMAIGITLAVVGTTLGIGISILGVVIFLYTLFRWVRDTRRDIEELPESHAHPGEH